MRFLTPGPAPRYHPAIVGNTQAGSILDKFESVFWKISAVILLGTGFLKVATAIEGGRGLSATDPILLLSNRWVFALAGFVELAGSIYLLLAKVVRAKLAVVAWIGTIFVVYRFGIALTGSLQSCHCLGNAAAWFPWLGSREWLLSGALLAFLLSGSYGCLLIRWMRRGGNCP